MIWRLLSVVALCMTLTMASSPSSHPYYEVAGAKPLLADPTISFRAIRHLTCGTSTGSGAIIAPNMVLTAAHVVGSSEHCIDTITEREGRIAYRDIESDIAVIEFPEDALPNRKMPISCDGFKRNRVYQAYGWQLGEEFVMQRLVAEETTKQIRTHNGVVYRDLYRLRGTIIPGMSGGPIVDTNGAIVGTNQTTDWDGMTNFGEVAHSRQLKDTFICQLASD